MEPFHKYIVPMNPVILKITCQFWSLATLFNATNAGDYKKIVLREKI